MATKKHKNRPTSLKQGHAKGGSANLSPKELEQVFRRLAMASGRMFLDQTTFLITEQSAHILLTQAFDSLADAAKHGRLQRAASKILAGAKRERKAVGQIATKLHVAWYDLPVFGEDSGRRVGLDIKDCIFPPVP